MRWVNFLALLLVSIGHAELVVTALNRLHGLRLSCRTLQRLRNLHDVLLPGVPLAMFVFVGFSGPGLLVGGSWSDVPAGWLAWFAACSVGLVGLAASSVRWWLHRPPECQPVNHSSVVDVARRLGYRPVGRGPLRSLTRLPGNQVFQLEIAEKTLALPRLPREWDGLSILHLSDLHFTGTISREFFEHVIDLAAGLRADLAVFTGDLLDRQDLTEWLPATLGRIETPLGRYFILGNHDWFLDPQEIRRELMSLGWTSLVGQVVTIDRRGQRLEIGGTELPWMGGHPEFEEQGARDEGPGQVRGGVSSFGDREPGAFRILLSHTPDQIGWARRQGVDLMLAGHNHGGQVVLPVVGPVYSPSLYGVEYAGGTFWRPPTLLHVSRGVSGRHPLRWNCRPEITKLVLRPA
ncbi:MAG TPA: metallophosphoesterase [Planctomycetaceae bacterium]|nr:metallophosphoesterase [Planctomycetaceae bacterium]